MSISNYKAINRIALKRKSLIQANLDFYQRPETLAERLIVIQGIKLELFSLKDLFP